LRKFDFKNIYIRFYSSKSINNNENNINNMKVAKTIKCRVFNPTKTKYDILNQEYSNLQEFLQLKDIFWWDKDLGNNLYSVHKQQAERFYKTIKKDKKYPISIRKDIIDIEKKDTKITKYWFRFRTNFRRGGIWLPIKVNQDIPKDCEFGESKLFKKDGEFYINIVIKKEVKIKKSYSNVLAIDLGEKVMATVLLDNKPIFYGKEIRGLRRHYAYIRKQLGKKKLPKKIKQIGHKEQRKVNLILHEISKEIVVLATKTDSAIVIGDLKGIRKSTKNKGKRLTRIVSNMAYFKLTQYITYKANWKGIKVIKINEKGTSHICPKCGSKGKRPYQGLFKCPNCGYQANADFVGAQNIKKRFEEYISSNGALVHALKSSDMVSTSATVSRKTEKINSSLCD